MSLKDMFLKKTPKELAEELANKTVHDDVNRFTHHVLDVQQQARKVDISISQAKAESRKLQQMLTITERIWGASKSNMVRKEVAKQKAERKSHE